MSEASIYQLLRGHMADLRLTAAAEVLPRELERARTGDLSHVAFLESLLAMEVEAVHARRLASLTRFAGLPSPLHISDFDFEAQHSVDAKLVRELETLQFLQDATNVLMIGPPGVGNYVELGVMWRNGHPLQLKGQMAVKLVYITMIPISFV